MIFQKTDADNDHKISRAEFIQHCKLVYAIKHCQWDVLFDELDADKSGALSHTEFWTKMAIKNSSNLMDALNEFDVSMTNRDYIINRLKRRNPPCAAPLCVVSSFFPMGKEERGAQRKVDLFSCFYL